MLGNCTSLPDPYGTDMLLSMIQRGMCGVRERNGVVGIAPPLPEVPASSRCMNNLRAGRWWCYHMAATFASSRAFTVLLAEIDVEMIGVGVTAEAQSIFNGLSKMRLCLRLINLTDGSDSGITRTLAFIVHRAELISLFFFIDGMEHNSYPGVDVVYTTSFKMLFIF
ncbi:hypothetical protein HanHA300_Chr10g0356031 [Helianthus annuus]|nr:hypothetical protein HanHA300_Chr10g0356031 [Helianthus annuus]